MFLIPLLGVVNGVDVQTLRDHVLAAPVKEGKYGDYPWDRWQHAAEQVGLPERLVALGRAIFREAYQHGWDDMPSCEAGWLDGGTLMLIQGLAFPEACEQRWDWLLATDGGRGDEGKEPPRVLRDPREICRALKERGYTPLIQFPDDL
jgi:hypothetical protein